MIELCTKRRMIISIVVLGVLTILVLILEEGWTSGTVHPAPTVSSHVLNHSSSKYISSKDIRDKEGVLQQPHQQSAKPDQNINQYGLERPSNKAYCWMYEDFEVVQDCVQCTKFEISSKTPIACLETGLKEIVKCVKSGLVYRSCTAKSVAKQRFWIFESLMLLLAVITSGLVKFRSSQLERKAVKQIEKRLASGY